MPADWGRRTGKTADNKRQAYFDALSDDDKVKSKLYIKEGKPNDGYTPATIPKVFKPLLKFKFFCKHCGDYHSHSAGAAFCEKNPEREQSIANAKKKAADHYYKRGRKLDIAHGNNVHKERIRKLHREAAKRLTPEQIQKRNDAIRAISKDRVISEDQKQKIREGVKKYALTPERVELSVEKENLVPANLFGKTGVEEFFEQKRRELAQNGFKSFQQDIRREDIEEVDEFSNRHYDANGDFDPFA